MGIQEVDEFLTVQLKDGTMWTTFPHMTLIIDVWACLCMKQNSKQVYVMQF